MKKNVVLIALTVLAIAPCWAMADVGMPLVWGNALDMFMVTVVLGLLEGGIIARYYSLGFGRCITAMVFANYISAWFVLPVDNAMLTVCVADIRSATHNLVVLVLVTYLVTALVEWPFIALCCSKTTGWFRKSVKVSIVVQALSHLIIFGGFWFIRDGGLDRCFSVTPSDKIRLPSDVEVFMIAAKDGNVYRRSSNGREDMVCKLAMTGAVDYLEWRPSKTSTNCYDLVGVSDTRPKNTALTEVLTAAVCTTSTPGRLRQPRRLYPQPLSPTGTESVNISMLYLGWGLRPIMRLTGGGKQPSYLSLAFGNHTVRWPVSGILSLSSDLAIVELRTRKLCLLDTKTKRIALWNSGYGAVVVTEEVLPSNEEEPAK